MPNSEIAISPGADGVVFEIAIPEPELRLALPQTWGRTADLLAEPHRSALARYFDAHFAVRTSRGEAVPHVIQSITRWQAQNLDVGKYEELRIRIDGACGRGLRSAPLLPALRRGDSPGSEPLRAGLSRPRFQPAGSSTTPVEVGVIRYDFARDVTPAFEVTLAAGNAWRGAVGRLVAGFSPCPERCRSSAVSGVPADGVATARIWRGAGRCSRDGATRCADFSASAWRSPPDIRSSLLLGAYSLVHLPVEWVETAIALSVLLAAAHAIRPLFAGSEWKIAAGFGLVHGLAFSETLSGIGRAGIAWTLCRAPRSCWDSIWVSKARSSWRWPARCRCCTRADGAVFMCCGSPPWPVSS